MIDSPKWKCDFRTPKTARTQGRSLIRSLNKVDSPPIEERTPEDKSGHKPATRRTSWSKRNEYERKRRGLVEETVSKTGTQNVSFTEIPRQHHSDVGELSSSPETVRSDAQRTPSSGGRHQHQKRSSTSSPRKIPSRKRSQNMSISGSRASPTSYAGAKFSESPAAKALPPPPLTWVMGSLILNAVTPAKSQPGPIPVAAS
jgi:hypothetical protein